MKNNCIFFVMRFANNKCQSDKVITNANCALSVSCLFVITKKKKK